jgi:hypothetical protein
MSYLSKFVVALVGVLALAIVTSRQLFLFAVFSDPQGLIGSAGRGHHLWLAIGVGVEACIAGSLMFYFFLRYQNYKWSKILMTPAGPLLLAHGDKLSADVRVAIPFDPIRWALANPWLAEGQSDDRRPTNGSVAQSGQTGSGQRAFARRRYQLEFKKWSQARHE